MQRRPARPLRAPRLAWPLLAFLVQAAGPVPAQQQAPDHAPDSALFLSSLEWRIDDPDFGGWSGLELSGDGLQFLAISDRGRYATGRVLRQGDTLTAVETDAFGTLPAQNGSWLPEWLADAEGLALAPDGRFYVSFEQRHRIWLYDRPALPKRLSLPRDFDQSQANGGIEALALAPDGTLVAIPEYTGAQTVPFPIYARRGKDWSVIAHLPRRGGFLVTGADFDASGRLYVLERAFSGLRFASRVRRLTFGPGTLLTEETLLETPLGLHDNLEGLAVWTDDLGRTRLTMVSDDNFRFVQRTEIVDYVVTRQLQAPAAQGN